MPADPIQIGFQHDWSGAGQPVIQGGLDLQILHASRQLLAAARQQKRGLSYPMMKHGRAGIAEHQLGECPIGNKGTRQDGAWRSRVWPKN